MRRLLDLPVQPALLRTSHVQSDGSAHSLCVLADVCLQTAALPLVSRWRPTAPLRARSSATMSAFRAVTTAARQLRLEFLPASEPLADADDALLRPLQLLCAQWGIPVLVDRSTPGAATLETSYYVPEKQLMQVFSIRCPSAARAQSLAPARQQPQRTDHNRRTAD